MDSERDPDRTSALSQLARGIVHDVNNALAPAALYAQILLAKETALSDSSRQYLEVIRQSIENVTHSMNRIRELYRPGGEQAAPLAMDVNQLARQVIDLTREMGIAVETDFAPDLPAAMADEAEVRETITNVLSSAAGATQNGGALIMRTSMADRAVQLEVIARLKFPTP